MACRRQVSMPDIEVFLFGPPRIVRDAVSAPVARRKTLALLAYLAVTGQPHARDALEVLLWPEEPPGRGRAVLRNALLDLSHAIGREHLAAEGDRVALREGAGLHVDVTRFCALLAAVRAHRDPPDRPCDRCLDALTEAAALYRADFLEGFTLRDTGEFDAWQTYQTERLRTALGSGRERLARGLTGRGDTPAAIEHAQRWVSLHPANEAAVRCLMRLHAAAGDRGAVAHQYRACAQALSKELGVAPDPETTATYVALVHGKALSPG
jgi:DNA-binding SARP family transcriptional activator